MPAEHPETSITVGRFLKSFGQNFLRWTIIWLLLVSILILFSANFDIRSLKRQLFETNIAVVYFVALYAGCCYGWAGAVRECIIRNSLFGIALGSIIISILVTLIYFASMIVFEPDSLEALFAIFLSFFLLSFLNIAWGWWIMQGFGPWWWGYR